MCKRVILCQLHPFPFRTRKNLRFYRDHLTTTTEKNKKKIKTKNKRDKKKKTRNKKHIKEIWKNSMGVEEKVIMYFGEKNKEEGGGRCFTPLSCDIIYA